MSDEPVDKLLAAAERMDALSQRMAGQLSRLEERDDVWQKRHAEQIAMRTAIMDRMDRLQDSLTAIRDDIGSEWSDRIN
jgi:hypothetical protein